MDVNQIFAAFEAAAESGEIDGSLLPQLGDLVGLLNVDVLPLTGGDASETDVEARLTGTTTWPDALDPSTTDDPIETTLWTIDILGTQAQLRMELRIPNGDPTLLGSVFEDMPTSMVPWAQSPGGLVEGPSVLNDLVLTDLQISGHVLDEGGGAQQPADLKGRLEMADGPLAPYTGYLGTNTIWVEGPLTFQPTGRLPSKPDVPVVDLAGDAVNAGNDFPDLTVGRVGIRLYSAAPNLLAIGEIPPPSSAVELVFAVEINTGEINNFTVAAPLLRTSKVWSFKGAFDPPFTLNNGIAGIMSLFPGLPPGDFSLPAGLAPFAEFGISQLEFGLVPPDGLSLPKNAYTSGTIISTTAWDLPLPFLSIQDVGTRWVVQWHSSGPSVSGSVFGTMVFGTDREGSFGGKSARSWDNTEPKWPPVLDREGKPVELHVHADIPSFDVTARTEGRIDVDLAKAIEAFFPGVDTGPLSKLKFTVEEIAANASIRNTTYGATLRLSADDSWSVDVNDITFSLKNMFFQVVVAQGAVSGSLNGSMLVSVDGQGQAILGAGAYLSGDGTWTFLAGLDQGEIDLGQFAKAFLGFESPVLDGEDMGALVLTDLLAEYSTAEGNPYSVTAALESRWQLDLVGVKLALTAEASIQRYVVETSSDLIEYASQPHLVARGDTASQISIRNEKGQLRFPDSETLYAYSGRVLGGFQLNGLNILAGLSFDTQEEAPTYLFDLMLDRFALQARTAWVDDDVDGKRRQVLTAELSGATLGEMIQSFARLANPNQNYRLEPPWTFLNKIDLGRFKLVLDPKKQAATLQSRAIVTLGFISLKAVGLRYERANGKPQILIELDGSFLGKTYDAENGGPLSWDALNDAPPVVPGKGDQLIKVRYLGLGQHVRLTDLAGKNTVSDIISTMQAELLPVDDPFANPLDRPGGSNMEFSGSSQWLIGLDMTLMGAASIKVVMNDPVLYGILVSLSGPMAAGLSGFSFELLYKKISDDVGLFHTRLQVPDVFRQLDFGVIQISLGIITVDIYTDGDFFVDLGFPHDRDFSLSFGVAYGVFIGRGGIYFGILKGGTSLRVPQITNGTFDPVVELGVGLAVGVGRLFNKGPLRADLIVQVELVFQGSLAWYKPENESKSRAMYYWARGTAALTGRLSGRVSLKIITVDVNVLAGVSATLTLEIYRATLIELSVSVRVSGKVKIGWVKIGYGFDTALQAAFTVGSDQKTPWVLAPNQNNNLAICQEAHRPVLRRRRPYDVRQQLLRSRQSRRLALDNEPVWNPETTLFPEVTPNNPRNIPIKLQPGFTAANVEIDDDGSAFDTQAVFLLFADSATPPDAETIAETQKQTAEHSAQATTPQQMAFNSIIEAMLRWAVSSLQIDPIDGSVSLADLAVLNDRLSDPQTMQTGFNYDTLSALFDNNLQFQISKLPVASSGQFSGVIFPMPPPVNWALAGQVQPADAQRSFSSYQLIDDFYADGVAAYFAKLGLHPEKPDQLNADGPDLNTTQSLATYIFRSYMALVSRSAVQAAEMLLEEFPYQLKTNDTLADIAGHLNEANAQVTFIKDAGDTVEQIAAEYGLTPGEMLYLNSDLPGELAASGPGDEITIALGTTPQGIAADNGDWPVAPGKTVAVPVIETQILDGDSLSAIADRFGSEVQDWQESPGLLNATAILRPGAGLDVTGLVYDNSGSGLSLREVAAVFFVRLLLGDYFPPTDWYAQAIAQLNDEIGVEGKLPPTVLIPPAYKVLEDPLEWETLPGDTLDSLARTIALAQTNDIEGTPFEEFYETVLALNETLEEGIVLPDSPTFIERNETLLDLATRLLMIQDDGGTLMPTEQFNQLVAGLSILQPLAPISVTQARLTTKAGQTLAGIADAYGLSTTDIGFYAREVAGFLSAEGAGVLTIRALPALEMSTLVKALLTDAPAATIAGQVTRFMLHGQRMPAPKKQFDKYRALGEMTGLYKLIGQQFKAPSVPSFQDFSARITIAPTDWLELVDSEAVGPDETAQLLASRYSRFHEFNPAANEPGRLKEGMCILTQLTKDLVFRFTSAELTALYPDSGLTPSIIGAPTRILNYRDVENRYSLSHDIIWQTPKKPQLAAFSSNAVQSDGMPRLWPFPADLQSKVLSQPAQAWTLSATNPAIGPDAPVKALDNYVWATLLTIKLHTVPGRPNTYELSGANAADTDRLLGIWKYLDEHASDDADLSLLYQLSPAVGLPEALTSQNLDPAKTYLVKTNLSTKTRSPVSAQGADGSDSGNADEIYFAPLDNAKDFIRLLWEASIVGGAGFWLEVTNVDSSGIPSSIFTDEGGGQISVLVTLNSQTDADPSRDLRTFNTCALVARPLDVDLTALSVSTEDGSDTVRHAILPPGEIGFQMTVRRPESDTGNEPDMHASLNELYTLLAYQLSDDSPAFEPSNASLPSGAQVPDAEPGTQLDETLWRYQETIPIRRFAKANKLQTIPGLPPPGQDPYAGIELEPVGQQPQSAAIDIWFQDIFGNATSNWILEGTTP